MVSVLCQRALSRVFWRVRLDSLSLKAQQYRYVEVALLRSYVISLLRYAAMSQFGCTPFTLFAFSVCTKQCTVIEQNGMSVIDSSDPSCLELLSRT